MAATPRLAVHLLLNGDAAKILEQLVSRLSLEPGIHTVHWHSADDESALPVSAAPSPAQGPDLDA